MKVNDMKYIRTKSCIYEVESVFKEDGFVKGYNVNEMNFIRKDQVIKQADTIEELCDGFLVDDFDLEIFKKFKAAKLYALKYNFTCHGFIVTNRGLNFVAKMNEAGNLELI